MIDLDLLLTAWARWQVGVDEREAKKQTGVKPFGLEYRLMVEAGHIKQETRKNVINEDVLEDVDLAWRRIYRFYPQEMEAVRVYYLRKKSYRAVREHQSLSQHMSKVVVVRGQDMIRGAISMVV